MKTKLIYGSLLVWSTLMVGCTTNEPTTLETTSHTSSEAVEQQSTKGQALTTILTATNWQGTRVYDNEGTDVTAENQNFIGLAKYDAQTGFYEFFTKEKESRGDEGTFFITNDGKRRILISQTMNYQAVVEITELTDEVFTYKRLGKDKAGQDVEVFVEHVPVAEELTFTNGRESLTTKTGDIVKESGATVLGQTLWNGTKVLDEKGNDVTKENQGFISLAKFDATTNQYEFFDLTTGESRGDFGYYDVLDENKLRAHVSIGENSYGAVLEITELNAKKFTYKRLGKDQAGNEQTVFVEHEPYQGKFTPEFTF